MSGAAMRVKLLAATDGASFGARLAAARKAHGLTQTRLATLLGVSLPRYHAWERNLATPNSTEIYRQICRQLDVTVDWLFFGNPKSLSSKSRVRIMQFVVERGNSIGGPPPPGAITSRTGSEDTAAAVSTGRRHAAVP